MLTPPITQRDVDEGTLFRMRCGKTARILSARADSIAWPWKVETSGDLTYCVVASDGRRLHFRTTSDDLIARIQEPNMNKVTVEDRRKSAVVERQEEFSTLNLGEIFYCGSYVEEAYLKTSSINALKLTGDAVGSFTNISKSSNCTPLPHLRLTLVLNDA